MYSHLYLHTWEEIAMTREQAWALLTQYNKEPFHLRHAITVEHVMGWFAQKLGYGEEKKFWSQGGSAPRSGF